MTALRESPYRGDHDLSIARAAERGRKPRDLGEYLGWFMRHWQDEMPDRIHARGVWHDRVSRGEAENGIKPIGGSKLGAPQHSDPFRRLIENSPFELEAAEYEGHQQIDLHYVRPLHATIARMGHRRPMTAAWLAALAACGGDWQSLATRRGWSHEEASLYLEAALYICWRDFDTAPREGYLVRLG